jgi:TonB family protein
MPVNVGLSARLEEGVTRDRERVGFVASALIHVMVLLAIAQLRSDRPIEPPVEDAGPPPEPIARIRMPPPEVLRPPGRAAPPVAPRPPQPTPPPRQEAKDRISVGGPAPVRQRTPLILRRDEDLTRNVAKGRPDAERAAASPGPPATPPPEVAQAEPTTAAPATPPPSTLVADAVADEPLAPTGRPGPSAAPGPRATAPPGPSIAGSLRNLEERIAGGDVRGIASGTGQQMGDLFFDPRGADFTSWYNTFKNEVYRNWIVPPSVSMGIRGHVTIEFVVDRDGTMSAVRIVRPSGTPSLDRAARNALLGSRLAPLPTDYGPPQVAMQVTFFYNETGAGS